MKYQLLLLSVICITLQSCLHKNDKMVELRFCADVLPDQLCVGEDTIFTRGRVWAQLLLNQGFNDTAVIGNLYNFQNGERVFIGSKVHQIDAGEKIIMEALILSIKGNFEVEFLDTRGNLLAKKRFEIW